MGVSEERPSAGRTSVAPGWVLASAACAQALGPWIRRGGGVVTGLRTRRPAQPRSARSSGLGSCPDTEKDIPTAEWPGSRPPDAASASPRMHYLGTGGSAFSLGERGRASPTRPSAGCVCWPDRPPPTQGPPLPASGRFRVPEGQDNCWPRSAHETKPLCASASRDGRPT